MESGRLLPGRVLLFEYLMPLALDAFLLKYPFGALAAAAVQAQQTYAARKRVPWGISSPPISKLDEGGNYRTALLVASSCPAQTRDRCLGDLRPIRRFSR